MFSPEKTMSDAREVVVVDVKIPFWSMVVLLVKWAIAAIPAFVILAILGTLTSMVLAAVFHWPWMGRGMV
jgi:hypothetical protein